MHCWILDVYAITRCYQPTENVDLRNESLGQCIIFTFEPNAEDIKTWVPKLIG